jgi:drug/metabolite transporter (DMT)-like permease
MKQENQKFVQFLKRNSQESVRAAMTATFMVIFALAIAIIFLLFVQTEAEVSRWGEYSWGNKIPPWKVWVVVFLPLIGGIIIMSFWYHAIKNVNKYFNVL